MIDEAKAFQSTNPVICARLIISKLKAALNSHSSDHVAHALMRIFQLGIAAHSDLIAELQQQPKETPCCQTAH